jgi:tetratricopeptide (TPR) repeat protein
MLNMAQLIQMTAIVLGTIAVVISVRHVVLAFAARRQFVDVLAKWLSDDFRSRGEAESILREPPGIFDDNFRAQLLKRMGSLPDRARKEIMSGLENHSQEGRAEFLKSILAEVLLKSGGMRDEPTPFQDAPWAMRAGVGLAEGYRPYKTESAASSWRRGFAFVWSGAAGFGIGVAAAGLAVAVIGERVTLPEDLADLQRRAEQQEIARQVGMLVGEEDAEQGVHPETQQDKLALDDLLSTGKGAAPVKPDERVWRLSQVGDLYLKARNYDKAKAYFEAARKIALEFDLEAAPGIYKNLGDLYVQKGDTGLAKEFYTKSLGIEPAAAGAS